MAKTYTLTATSINGGRKSSYESDWRNYSANENKDAGRRNDDYKATNILFNATTLASLRSKPILSIKLKLTITNGTIYTSGSYARQLIGYKLNSTATTSSAGSAWTRSDANSTAASGAVYAGQILADTETTITTATQVTFDLTGSSVPVYGYVIGPSRSSLSSYSYITISAATLEVITNEYNITYNANGGSGAPAAQVKTHGTALTLSSTRPTRDSEVVDTYIVTYNANGGSVSPGSATASQTKSYDFIQWNTKSDGTGTNYSPGGSYTANASATLYAQWASSTSTPFVTLPTPTRANYTFNGWFTATIGGTRIGGGGDIIPASTRTLYAQWSAITYTVAYDGNGPGSSTIGNMPSDQTKYHGTTLTLRTNVPTRSADEVSYTVQYNAHGGSVSPGSTTATTEQPYSFLRWNTQANGSGTNYSPGGLYTSNAAVTLYAQWAAGSITLPSITLPTPTRTGYNFNGWYTASSGGSRVGGGGDSYSPSASVTLHAQWTLKTYTVSYNKNGASGSTISNMPSSQTKTYGTDLTLSNNLPTRANESAGSYRVDFSANSGSVSPSYLNAARTNSFTFAKWNTKSDGTGTNYSRGGTYSTNASATLYARWTSSTSTAAITLPTPTRSGYLFNGWYTAASGGTRKGGGGDSYTPTAATTLYAQWSAQKSTVSTTNGTLGTAQTITITRNSSSFKHTLTYSYGSATGTIATKTTSVSVSWTPPTSLASQFPSATSGTCTITCQTFDGNTSLGTTTTTCSLAIPASIKPTISSFTATPQSSNMAISGWGVLVKGYSTVALSVSKTLNGGATLASIAFSGPGISSTGTSTTATTSTMTTTGSKTWTVIVTDSRGRTATTTVSKTVYDYANPVISSIEVCRCNSDGTLNNNSGTYIKFKPHFSVSSVNGNNGLATSNGAMLKWRVSGGSYGTAFAVTNDTWTAVQGGGAISTASTYEGQLTVTDKVGNSTTLTVTLPGSSGLWYGRGNDRLGLGSAPSGAGLYCDWNATFKGVVDVTPRRCEASLGGAGWYRAIIYNAYNEASAKGSSGEIVRIRIVDTSMVNLQHEITLVLAYGKVSFVNELSVGTNVLCDKIRYTYAGSIGHVDIHITHTSSITYNVSFDVATRTYAMPNWYAGSLASVADSPSGETVMTEYTFAANTEANGSVTAGSGVTINEMDIKRSGRIVYVHFYATGTFAANTSYTLGTLSGVPMPTKHIRWMAGGGGNAYNAKTPVYAILDYTNSKISAYASAACNAINITVSYIV